MTKARDLIDRSLENSSEFTEAVYKDVGKLISMQVKIRNSLKKDNKLTTECEKLLDRIHEDLLSLQMKV